MMQWIDLYAAPLLVLLLLAALGGFFAHERWHLPVAYARGVCTLTRAWRWLSLGTVAALTMAWMTWDVAQSVDATCTGCMDWRGLDTAVQSWVQTQAHAAWMPAVQCVTQLGHLDWMAALGALMWLWLLYRRAWLLAGAWVLGVAGVGLWVRIIKHAVARERPVMHWVLEQGYSFPSGHSAGTLMCYGMLAWIVMVLAWPAKPRWVVAVAFGLVLVVGVSRVLLGVHYASDVLAGWLLGGAWLALVLGASDIARFVANQRCKVGSG